MAATDTRQRTTLGTRFRFLVRFVGLTGILAVAIGVASFVSAFPNSERWTVGSLAEAAEGAHGSFAKIAALTLAAGLVAVVFALIVEIAGGLSSLTGRRTAANTSATV